MQFSAVTLLSLCAAVAVANPAPLIVGYPNNAADVYIKSVTLGGSGCPQGSYNYSLSADKTIINIEYDQFDGIVQSLGSRYDRKNCQINIDLNTPRNTVYSIFATNWRGFASLDPGCTATLSGIYYFAGEPQQTISAVNFTGPITVNYEKSDTANLVNWSQCGSDQLLNIDSQIYVTCPSFLKQALFTVDSTDGKYVESYSVAYKTC